MSYCRDCRKRVKWLEVPIDTPNGTHFQWKKFDGKKPPYRPHECKTKKENKRDPGRDLPRPWWIDRD